MLSPFPPAGLDNYFQLLRRIDDIAATVTGRFSSRMNCRPGCSSCCRHLTLFPVEAAALARFLPELPPETRALLSTRSGTGTEGPCPLLENDHCLAYGARPIICRTHGLPLMTAINGGRNIDFCPDNFRGVDSIPGDCILNLDVINQTLVAVNARYLADACPAGTDPDRRYPVAAIISQALSAPHPSSDQETP